MGKSQLEQQLSVTQSKDIDKRNEPPATKDTAKHGGFPGRIWYVSIGFTFIFG